MVTQTHPLDTLRQLGPAGVATAGIAVAGMCGLLMAVRPAAGIGFALALLFVPLAFINLPVALVLIAPIPFLRFLPAVWIGPTFAFLVVLVAWLGTLGKSDTGRRLVRHRPAILVFSALLVWLIVSLSWAEPESAEVGWDLINWVLAGLVALIFATTPREERHVRLILGAFVAGAVLSVMIGLLSTGLQPASSAVETATYTEGRLKGGVSDPNYLAAGLVPAIVLAMALVAGSRTTLGRWALLVSVGIAAVGLGATQSRGGFLAALAAAGLALLVMRRYRLKILAVVVLVGALAGLWFAAAPGAWERISEADGGGSGRAELWLVAWRVVESHPVVGVGFGGFERAAAEYVRQPGQLTTVKLIVDDPHVVHNTYLQMLAETGVVGLALFLGVLGSLLAAALRAARLFEAHGDARMATLARALFVAQASGLVALFFVSNATDVGLWLLFGLGGAMLLLARRGVQVAGIDPHPARRTVIETADCTT